MARIEVDPNYSSPTFSRATAAADIFKKEDVQALAAAMSTHTHDGAGKGLAIAATGIPAGSITSAMIADGTITSTDIADGTIQAVDIANATITNAKLGTDVARANLLTNGGFEIWQRGNGPFATNGAFTADRWALGISAGSTMSVSRDTANQDVASQACAAVTYTHSNTSYLIQAVAFSADGGLVQQLRGKTISISARVRTSTANAVRAGVFGTVLGTHVTGTAHTGDGTYQTLTVSATVPATETNLQLELNFTASCTAYIDNAMLVVGSQPCDYVPMHPADDLARCQRYYEIVGAQSVSVPQMNGYQAAGQQALQTVSFKARKAVAPTVTKNGTWTVTNCGQPAAVADTDVWAFYVVASALGALTVRPTDATCSFTFEANP